MNIVYGFGGFRSDGATPAFNPALPEQWETYEFRLRYQGVRIRIRVSAEWVSFSTQDRVREPVPLLIYGKHYLLDEAGITVPTIRTPNREYAGEACCTA
jgi:maltose phosphorylase